MTDSCRRALEEARKATSALAVELTAMTGIVLPPPFKAVGPSPNLARMYRPFFL